MGGAKITNVSYTGVTMKDAATPILIKIGDRGRCPGTLGPGSISGITFNHVTGTHLTDLGANYTSTITGMPGHPISNVTVENVDLTVPGSDPAAEATIVPPAEYGSYVPKDLGTRPVYG